jgi:hypothetical protein
MPVRSEATGPPDLDALRARHHLAEIRRALAGGREVDHGDRARGLREHAGVALVDDLDLLGGVEQRAIGAVHVAVTVDVTVDVTVETAGRLAGIRGIVAGSRLRANAPRSGEHDERDECGRRSEPAERAYRET